MTKTARKRKHTPKEPGYVLVTPTSTETASIPPDLASLPADLHYRRERTYANAAACRFENWLQQHCAENRIPLDNIFRAYTLVTLYVRCMLLARVEWPECFVPVAEEPEEPEPDVAYEADAIRAGLTIQRRRRGDRRPAANLPGCAGGNGTCTRMRRYGERYCPKCRKLELERLRNES